jgi:hypothetical protein
MDIKQLRDECNANGISCKGKNGKFLGAKALTRKLQFGGRPAKEQESEVEDKRIKALNLAILKEFSEMIKGDSNEYVWELMKTLNIPDDGLSFNGNRDKTEQAFHMALLKMDMSKEIREELLLYPDPENNPDHREELFQNVAIQNIEFNDPRLMNLTMGEFYAL